MIAIIGTSDQPCWLAAAFEILLPFCTGHSLGGAMATLAAYDIRTGLQAIAMSNIEVVCYTFAAPRTGNHAFARDYNATIPDTWSVINGQVCSHIEKQTDHCCHSKFQLVL